MSQGGSNKKVSSSLLALSSAAILAVYAAGYSRTHRFVVQIEERRPTIPVARGGDVPLASAVVMAPTPSAPSDLRRETRARPSATASSESAAEVLSAAAAPAPSTVETPAAEAAPVIVEPKVEPKVEAPAAPPAPQKPVWKDGTYTGWGYSRHGDIEASVVIEGGRIVSATIAQCLTRYSCSVIEKLPPEVAQRQSPDVDTVSGATQSADAFYYGVVEALAKAK